MFWFSLLVWAATTILGELLRPKPKFDTPQPSSLGDFNIPTAEEGRAIPVAWGTVHIKGANVLWYGNLTAQPIIEKVKTGLFSKTTVVRGYLYSITMHLGICHGVIGTSGSDGGIDASSFEIRFDNRVPASTFSENGSAANAQARGFGQHVEVGTRPIRYAFAISDPNFLGGPDKGGGIVGPVHIYTGGLWHPPNEHLQGLLGADIPAYRGITQAIVCGAYIGTSAFIPPISFVFTRCPSPRLYLDGDTSVDENANINGDANPAYMILECIMDTVWGLGVPQALIDLDSFYDVAGTLKGEGLGMSYVLDNPTEASGIIGDILRHVDGVVYTDPATGLIAIKLARKDYSESDLVHFDESSIVSCDFSRGSWSETKNVVKIIYIDGRRSPVTIVPSTRAYHFNNSLLEANSGALPFSLHGSAGFETNAAFGSHAIGDPAGGNWYADTGDAGTDHFNFDINEFCVNIRAHFDAFPDGTTNHQYALIFASADLTGGAGGITPTLNGQYALLLVHTTRQLVWVHKDANGNVRTASSANDVLGDPGEYRNITVSRSDGSLRASVEGQVVLALAMGSADILSGGSTFSVGGHSSSPPGFYPIKGVVDELHIVNGSPVWRTFPFEPPTEEQDYLSFSTVSDGDFVQKAAQQQNLSNIQARGGELAAEIIPFLGISNSENANKIAARVLKTLSYPFASGKIVLNRRGWTQRPGSVFVFDWPPLGIEGMIARVTKINYGHLLRNRIEIDAVEDVFGLAATAFAAPAPTEWEDPVGDVETAAAERLVELPYHFIGEDKRFIATLAMRASQLDLGYEVWSDRDGDTTTDLLKTNTVNQFVPSGTLLAEYDGCGDLFDTVGFTVEDGTDLEFLTSINATQLEQGVNLALVEDEFMAWRTVTDNGDGTFTFSRVIRGVLDTIPATHAAGARVWFFTDGFGIADELEYPDDIEVAAKLLPFNAGGVVEEADATLQTITLDSRAMRPYPPGNVLVNGEQCPDFFLEQDVTLTWSHRHRVLQTQDQVIVRQDAADYTDTPEGDYIVEIYIDATLHHTFEDFMLGSNMEVLYTFAQREADDPDLTKLVTMVITPINADGLTGTARSISFLMVTNTVLEEDMPYMPAAGMFPSATSGCSNLNRVAMGAGQPDIITLDFDAGATEESAQFSVMAPEGWVGDKVSFLPVWSHPATTTNFGVVFELAAVAFSNDDAMAANFGTGQTSTDTGGTTNDKYIGPESSPITIAGTPAAGDVIYFKITRKTGNGSDNLAVDARLHGIVLNWLDLT